MVVEEVEQHLQEQLQEVVVLVVAVLEELWWQGLEQMVQMQLTMVQVAVVGQVVLHLVQEVRVIKVLSFLRMK